MIFSTASEPKGGCRDGSKRDFQLSKTTEKRMNELNLEKNDNIQDKQLHGLKMKILANVPSE